MTSWYAYSQLRSPCIYGHMHKDPSTVRTRPHNCATATKGMCVCPENINLTAHSTNSTECALQTHSHQYQTHTNADNACIHMHIHKAYTPR